MCGLPGYTYNECLVFFGKLGVTRFKDTPKQTSFTKHALEIIILYSIETRATTATYISGAHKNLRKLQ
jgi:hypothetical protein